MVEQSVVAVSTKQGAWKDNSVKRNVVLGHELVELHFLGVLPPLLPLISVAGSDGQIATDCKYDIPYFTIEAPMSNKRPSPILAKKSCVGLIALELAPTVNYWFRLIVIMQS